MDIHAITGVPHGCVGEQLARPRPQRSRSAPGSRASCAAGLGAATLARLDRRQRTGDRRAGGLRPAVGAGSVAAVCGAGVRVRVTPAWDEPLVLWQAAVGEASTGKSAALAPMRGCLRSRRAGAPAGDEERRAAQWPRWGGKVGRTATMRLRAFADRGETSPIPSRSPHRPGQPARRPAVARRSDGVASRVEHRRGMRRGRRRSRVVAGGVGGRRGHRDATAPAGASFQHFPISIVEPCGRSHSEPRCREMSLETGRRQPARALPVRLAGAAALSGAGGARPLA